jgi:hypothetical protein
VPTYLVERYWPGVTSELLLEARERGRLVSEEMSKEGTRIREMSCTLIPGEEVVFSVYEAPTQVAVRQFNERADIPVSRIVEAVAVTRDTAPCCGESATDQSNEQADVGHEPPATEGSGAS